MCSVGWDIGCLKEGADYVIVTGVLFAGHSLYPAGAVYVHHGRYLLLSLRRYGPGQRINGLLRGASMKEGIFPAQAGRAKGRKPSRCLI